MIPTRAVFERMLVLLGADTLTFNKDTDEENMLFLIKSSFNPTAVQTMADLTEADFPGYGRKNCHIGAQPQSNDPATGDSLLDITLDAPALWETSAAPSPAQTIFGYGVCEHSSGALYAVATLVPNVILTGINQTVYVPRTFLRQLAGSVQ